MKIHVFLFLSGKMQLIKYGWSNLLPFGKVPSTISLLPVEKSVAIMCFVRMACRALGMTSMGDRAKICEDG
jgi:hypothetical protein